MNVKDLIEILQKEDQEREVVIYSPLSDLSSPLSNIWSCRYIPETDSYGELRLEELTDEKIKQGYTEEDVYGYLEDEDMVEFDFDDGSKPALAMSSLN